MPIVELVDDNGNVTSTVVQSRDVTFVEGPDDESGEDERSFTPAITQRVEHDHKGSMSSITSVCGETENRRESDEKPKLTVEGIIQVQNVNSLKEVKNYSEIQLVTDIGTYTIEIKRLTIEQTTDIVELEYDGTTDLAASFQMQCRVP